MRRQVWIVLLLFMLSASACAEKEGTWYAFTPDKPPTDMGFLVCDYSGTVTVTFLGDCTLGGAETSARKTNGFVQTVARNGYSWPFRGLVSLTANDDLTVANLEGVLSDRKLTRVEKMFNFIGPTAYTQILRQGSIECVTLANNHTYDYGTKGYSDTKNALDADGIAYFSTDTLAIWSWNGIQIGFVGIYGSSASFEQNAALLRDLGCSTVIAYMHAGREGTGVITSHQRQTARRAAASGCDLLVGSHPHVVQGWDLVEGMPVVYSLGNCSFGGNHAPDDMDALVLQAELTYEEGDLTGMTLHFYPISVSGISSRNDFSPVLLTGNAAERVLRKMEASTGRAVPDYNEQVGAAVWVDR